MNFKREMESIKRGSGAKMPKMKTRKSVAKRFKITGSGRVKRSRAGKGHLLTHKSAKRRRNLRGGAMASKSDEGNIKHMLGK